MRKLAALMGGILFFTTVLFLSSPASASEATDCGALCNDHNHAHAKPQPTKTPLTCFPFEQKAPDAVVLRIINPHGEAIPASREERSAFLHRLAQDQKYLVHEAPPKLAQALDQYCIGQHYAKDAVRQGYFVILCNGEVGGDKLAVFWTSGVAALLDGVPLRARLMDKRGS